MTGIFQVLFAVNTYSGPTAVDYLIVGGGGSGTWNDGGGGGAGGIGSGFSGSGNPGNGGSGVVIIRYLGSQRGYGGTVTSSGGYTYHTFTTSGTYTA